MIDPRIMARRIKDLVGWPRDTSGAVEETLRRSRRGPRKP